MKKGVSFTTVLWFLAGSVFYIATQCEDRGTFQAAPIQKYLFITSVILFFIPILWGIGKQIFRPR